MAKRNVKSSKTDHVLNMITSTGTENEQEKTEQKKIVPPVIEVANTKNDELSNAIDSALRQDVLEQAEEIDSTNKNTTQAEGEKVSEEVNAAQSEETNAAQSVEPAPQSEEASAPQSEEVSAPQSEEVSAPQSEEVSAPQSEEASAPQSEEASAPQSEEASAPQSEEASAPQSEEASEENSGIFVNIMEEIVDELKASYIKKFKMCDCQRCQSDVKAYALTNLPAKYVVLSQSTLTPMMGFYNSRYATDVKSKLIVACKVVSDSPRHKGFRDNY